MREFKRVRLDGKGGDIVRMDGKGGVISALDGKGDLSFWFKSRSGEDVVKPVPARFSESPEYTKPESLFASKEPDPYKYDQKIEPSEYKLRPGSQADEFTWKYSDRPSFKSTLESDKVYMKFEPPGKHSAVDTTKQYDWPTRSKLKK